MKVCLTGNGDMLHREWGYASIMSGNGKGFKLEELFKSPFTKL